MNILGSIKLAVASWTALAERSGDSALAWPAASETRLQSGVALRLPPQSKTRLFILSSQKNQHA